MKYIFLILLLIIIQFAFIIIGLWDFKPNIINFKKTIIEFKKWGFTELEFIDY